MPSCSRHYKSAPDIVAASLVQGSSQIHFGIHSEFIAICFHQEGLKKCALNKRVSRPQRRRPDFGSRAYPAPARGDGHSSQELDVAWNKLPASLRPVTERLTLSNRGASALRRAVRAS